MVREVVSAGRLSAMNPEAAAAYWMVQRSAGLTPVEQELFAQWLGRSGDNARAWSDVEQAWRCFDGEEDDELLSAMQAAAREKRPSARRLAPRHAVAAAVAILFLLMTTATLVSRGLFGDWGPEGSGRSQRGPIVYASDGGQVRTVALPDGSRVTLDSASAVEVQFTPASRALRLLRGRAFFEAAKNPERPFSVVAQGRQVVALGTRFDVWLRGSELRVALLEGRVAISPEGSGAAGTVLRPGQEFVERDGIAAVRSLPDDGASAAGWREGFLTFNDETLAAAAEQMNRYSPTKLVVRDPAVAALRVSGRFRSGDIARFSRRLSEILPVRALSREDGAIELIAAR
jgi:transmembrane sensor